MNGEVSADTGNPVASEERGIEPGPAGAQGELTLAVVSHSLGQRPAQARWRLLAQRYPVNVHLVVPAVWNMDWFGVQRTAQPGPVHEGRFHLHPLATSNRRKWGRYLFLSPDMKLRAIRPDVVYVIHEEMILVHHQALLCRRLWAPRAKYLFFTMHALGVPSRTTPTWIDTFPLTSVQAMACEVPVIGADSGAIPWQLRDKGMVFPEGDIPRLRECLGKLASDRELHRRLAREGRARSLANFCTGTLTDNFYDILLQTVHGRLRTDLPDDDQRKAYMP